MYFLNRMSGDNLQPLHQCLILFRCDLQCLFFCTGSAETAKLQPFVKEKKSVTFPYKPLDTVTASAAEEKKNILFIWIQLKVELNNGCQSIDSATYVCVSCSNINVSKSGCIIQHPGCLQSVKGARLKRNSIFPGRYLLFGLRDPDGKPELCSEEMMEA